MPLSLFWPRAGIGSSLRTLALLSSDIPTGCISAQLAADLGLTRVRAQPKGFWTPRGRVESEWHVPVWCQVKLWDLPPLLIILPILDQANALPMGTTIVFGKDFIEHGLASLGLECLIGSDKAAFGKVPGPGSPGCVTRDGDGWY
jgi:hypothetical protein